MIGVFALIDHYADDVAPQPDERQRFYLIPELTSTACNAAELDAGIQSTQGVEVLPAASGGDTPEREEDKPNEQLLGVYWSVMHRRAQDYAYGACNPR